MKYTAYSAALVAALILSACASTEKKADATPEPQKETVKIERTQEVAYLCGAGKKKQALRVMYGLNGNDVVAAQVTFDGKMSPVLLRNTANADSNVFENGPVSWIADNATAANVDKVNGNMLVMAGKQVVNGKEQDVAQIITKYCSLDKKTTARLNKAAAAKAQAGSSKGEAVTATP